MSTSVDIVSLYGVANAGVRARALGFLDRLDASHRLHSYFPGNTAGMRQFARSPLRPLAAEVALRRLAAHPPARLLLSREASPLGKGAIEERLLRSADHGVYDIDDALHEDVRSQAFETLFSKGGKASRAAAAAGVVIAGNDYLADWASDHNDDVRVIPTCLDPSAYTRKTVYSIGSRPRLLWLGTPSGERYLTMIGAALMRFRRETGATLTIIGDAHTRLGELESMIERVPWSLAMAQATVANFDIGLMPLDDTPYERGKCAYKLLEYGAAGLPAVASPVGVNAEVLHRTGAATPRSNDEWYLALQSTVGASAQSRAEGAARLRDIVERDFSFNRWRPDWRIHMRLDEPSADEARDDAHGAVADGESTSGGAS